MQISIVFEFFCNFTAYRLLNFVLKSKMQAARVLKNGGNSGKERDDRERRARMAFESGKKNMQKHQQLQNSSHQGSNSLINSSKNKLTTSPDGIEYLRIALGNFTAAVQESPANAAYYEQRANCFGKLGEYRLALFDYTMAIQIDEHPSVHNNTKGGTHAPATGSTDHSTNDRLTSERIAKYYGARGACLRHMGKLDDAIADFKKARHLDAHNGRWLLEIGVCWHDLGDKKRAVVKFTEALSEVPGRQEKILRGHYRTRALLYRGNTRRELGLIEDAITDLSKAVELDDSPENFNVLGLALFDAGEWNEAHASFSRACEKITAGNTTIKTQSEMNTVELADTETYGGLIITNSSALYLNNLGLACFQMGKYQEAIGHFEHALMIEGASSGTKKAMNSNENASILYNRGNARLALMQYNSALEDFEKILVIRNRYQQSKKNQSQHQANGAENVAVVSEEGDENVWHSMRLCHQEQMRIRLAIEHFSKAIKINPKFKPSLFHLGQMYHLVDDLFAAMDAFSKALKIDPFDRRAYESLGLVYCDLLYFDLAVGAFTKAINLLPSNGVNYFYRGKALLWLGRYEEAIENFDTAIAHKCDEPQVYNCKALASKYIGEYVDAVKDLSYAIKQQQARQSAAIDEHDEQRAQLDTTCIEYWYNRAVVYMEVKEYELAAADLTCAIKSCSGMQIYDADEAIHHSRSKQLPAAEIAAAAASTRMNDSEIGKLYYLRGKARYAMQLYEETIEDLKEALRLMGGGEENPGNYHPDAHDCYYYMGTALANTDRHEAALECFTSAVTLKPNTALYLHERAKSLQHEGRYQEAVVDFTKVISLQPLNAHAYFRRAFALKSLRRYKETAEDFDMAEKLQPHNPHLVINRTKSFDIEFIELCKSGEEPPYNAMIEASRKSVNI